MKKIYFQLGGVFLLVALFAAPALAGEAFKASLFCEGAGSGQVTIKDSGDVIIRAQGFLPNSSLGCVGACLCAAGGPEVFLTSACTTDSQGRLKATFEGAAAGIDCPCPAVGINGCATGFSGLE